MAYVFTSESVSQGHPDKLCDQISDALVDAYIAINPRARLAIETVATTNYVGVFGEVCSQDLLSRTAVEEIVRGVVRKVGFEQKGFHWQYLDFENRIHGQSVDISQGISGDSLENEGAGDQGIMFGYATNETPDYMPAPLWYAHRILQNLEQARRQGDLLFLGVDAKSQVSLRFDEKGIPQGIEAIVVSTQHHESASNMDIRKAITPHVMDLFPKEWKCPQEHFYVNPSGRFVIGGPDGDAGLTGRKIIVDTYGGAAPHGGGAFSGKDPSKVDRSGAYMARYLAKNIVASGLADRCTIQLSYAIGVAQPTSVYVNTHQTGKIDPQILVAFLQNEVDLTPYGIRQRLQLNRPIYQKTSCFGHFGRPPEEEGHFSWERLDLVDVFKELMPKREQ